jgi:hypothetical protein
MGGDPDGGSPGGGGGGGGVGGEQALPPAHRHAEIIATPISAGGRSPPGMTSLAEITNRGRPVGRGARAALHAAPVREGGGIDSTAASRRQMRPGSGVPWDVYARHSRPVLIYQRLRTSSNQPSVWP